MSEVCRILDVARSSVYYGKHHPKRSRVEAKEKELVRRVLQEQNNSFGRRVVRRLLARRGVMLSEYKIGKIFKELGHVSKYGRRKGKNVNTSPHTAEYRKENLLLQLSREQRRRLTIWHMDFTEVKVREGKEYQCGIVSEGDRILTGLETSSKCTAAFAVETVKKAIAVYGKPDRRDRAQHVASAHARRQRGDRDVLEEPEDGSMLYGRAEAGRGEDDRKILLEVLQHGAPAQRLRLPPPARL